MNEINLSVHSLVVQSMGSHLKLSATTLPTQRLPQEQTSELLCIGWYHMLTPPLALLVMYSVSFVHVSADPQPPRSLPWATLNGGRRPCITIKPLVHLSRGRRKTRRRDDGGQSGSITKRNEGKEEDGNMERRVKKWNERKRLEERGSWEQWQ